MPRIISKPPKPVKRKERTEFFCTRCDSEYKTRYRNFPKSRSPLYQGNERYMHICWKCCDELFEHYCAVLRSEDAAIKRMCEKLDVFYSEPLLETAKNKTKTQTYSNLFRSYMSAAGGSQYKDSYDDTHDFMVVNSIEDIDEVEEITNDNVSKKIIEFFGVGFTPEQYRTLQAEYKDWTTRHECQTKAQEELFKNITIFYAHFSFAYTLNQL